MSLAANALTTLAAAKLEIGQQAAIPVEKEPELEALINDVSTMVEDFLGRSLTKLEVTEKYRAPDSRRLVLRRTPVDAEEPVVVKRNGTALDAAGYEVEDVEAGILYREEGWDCEDEVIPGSASQAVNHGSGKKNLEVTYTGGFVTPGQANAPAAGGAVLVPPRAGTGSTEISGLAAAGSEGSLVLTLTVNEPDYDLEATFEGGAPYAHTYEDFVLLEDGVPLEAVDARLAGLVLKATVLPTGAPLEETWSITESIPPPAQTMPGAIERAVLVAVAKNWRARNAGHAEAEDVSAINLSLGRGYGGLLPDVVLAQLVPYRRLAR